MNPKSTEPETTKVAPTDPSAGNPFISGEGITKTPLNNRRADDYDYAAAARRINSEPSLSKKDALIIAGSAGVVGLAVLGGFALESTPTGPETRGTIDTTIESVTLSPDATLRTDPNLGEVNHSTELLHLDAQVVIDANHDIRVLTDTDNGTWYAIPTSEVKAVIPNLTTDEDVVWVNEQGAVVERTDLDTK